MLNLLKIGFGWFLHEAALIYLFLTVADGLMLIVGTLSLALNSRG